MLDVRNDPMKNFLKELTVTFIPAGGCISEEEVIDYKRIFDSNSELKLCVHKMP